VDPSTDRGLRIVTNGYNSPFEEFSIAIEINRRGIPAVYPRAIYMTGQEALPNAYNIDYRRYESHGAILTPDGKPALNPDYNYITVWGYWNGSDDLLARKDVEYCKGINLQKAFDDGRITADELHDLMQRAGKELAAAGFEDLNPEGTHWLLSVNPQDELIRGESGALALRMCNFGLVRRL